MVVILTGSMLESVKITSQKYLDSGRDSVHFDPNLFGSQIAPIFVIFVAESSFLPTSHTTQAQLCSPHVRQISPKAATKTKKWRRAEKDSLYNLVHAGFVDIGDLSLDIIKTVHLEHFCHCPVKNFHRNYKDISAAFELEAKYSCTPRNACGVCYC